MRNEVTNVSNLKIAAQMSLIGDFQLDNSWNVLEENGRLSSLLAGEMSVAVVAKIKCQWLLRDALLSLMIV